MEQRKLGLRQEKTLTRLGLLGFLLSLLSTIVYLWKGGIIPPHGELIKPITFDLAIGIFMLTTAVLLPLSGFGDKGKVRFRRWAAVTTLYAYAAETIQTFRGVDPRFAQTGFDSLAGLMFGLVSVGIIVLNAILAVSFFRKTTLAARPILVLGIRYGYVSVMLGFASGLWMVALQGHLTGMGGNVMALHFLGFHGLQAVTFAAWLLERSSVGRERASRLVHTAGAVWLAAVAIAFVQTVFGKVLTEFSLGAGAFYLLIIVWFSLTANSLIMARRSRTESN